MTNPCPFYGETSVSQKEGFVGIRLGVALGSGHRSSHGLRDDSGERSGQGDNETHAARFVYVSFSPPVPFMRLGPSVNLCFLIS